MYGRTIIFLALLGATAALPDVALAQVSPQRLIGGITRPFRQMLGHLGHFPRIYRRRAAAYEPRTGSSTPASNATGPAGLHFGWSGPPVWISAYEDVLGYTFWPDDYAGRLRSHGFDLIADTISGRFDTPRGTMRTATTGAAVRSDSNGVDSKDRCNNVPDKQADWPATRIEQTLHLSGAEPEALQKLQTAVVKAASAIKTDCGASMELLPPTRLGALVKTLWAVRDAGIFVRGPLKSFYDGLTEAQKGSLTSRQPQAGIPDDPKRTNTDMNRQYQACASQNSEKAERLLREIEAKTHPNKEQAASFENLRKVSSDMAGLLIASCAKPIPVDPLARLDDANDQLTAINYAATTVQIAFDGFYAKLDNDQKSRMDTPVR
jgi:hypothetical protein